MIQLIPWSELTVRSKAEIHSLHIDSQQIEYAGSIESAVAQCEAETANEVIGLAVVVSGAVVGFLLLKCGSKVPPWVPPHAAVISALRIDVEQQGKGFGTRALCALPSWVAQHWPSIRSIVLSVDEENTGAIRSYSNAGWVDQGTRVQGRIGWVRYMTRHVLLQQCPTPSVEQSCTTLCGPVHSPHREVDMQVNGSCHCGAISFTANIDPSQVLVCHCTDCQVLTGSAFRTFVPASIDSFALKGEPARYVKVASSGARRIQAFCPQCGTPVYSTPPEAATQVMLRVGTLEQRSALRPSLQIWQRSSLPWVQSLASVPGCQEQEALPPQ